MAKLGIVKNFLKFKHDMQFGVIGCGKSNISYLPDKKGEIGRFCMVGFAEDVIIWNVRTQEIVQRIHGRDQDNVTFVTYFINILNEVTISIGYESGYVSVYSLWDFKQILSLKCHRHPVTTIIYCEPAGDRIICGSMDTDITIIDIQSEDGFRIKGHTSIITKLQYVYQRDILISSSKDGSIKFWYLGQKHCFKTLSNNSDIWDFVYINATNLLITASTDPMLRMWQLDFVDQSKNELDLNEGVVDYMSNAIQAKFLGSVDRTSYKRVLQMVVDDSQSYIAINTGEKQVEIYKVMTTEEINKRLKRKEKKAKLLNQNPVDVTITADNGIKKCFDIILPDKCKSMSLIFNDKKSTLEMLTSMKNNTVAVMDVNIETKEMTVANHITRHGHRTAIVYSQFTSDGLGLFTVSLSELKIWEKKDFQSVTSYDWPRRRLTDAVDDEDLEDIKTEMEIAPGLKLEANTAVLLPGDRYAVVGFKVGVMILYSLVTGDVVQWMQGHQSTVTSLILTPDRTHLLSSSTDKCVKLWKIEYGVMNSGAKGKLQLTESGVCHEYSHGVSCLAVTPDCKTVLVALLNNKVQSFSFDNLGKRILDFYQHSQPVTCMAVKHDGTEMVTGSGDKSLIKWSLQFADCRIFKGHLAPVTDVQYVPGRAQSLSSDSSGLIVFVDLANMTEICRLRRHMAQITSLCVFSTGSGEDGDVEIASASVDCSVRLWFESDEILSPEAEAEEERDRRYEEEELAREELIVVGGPSIKTTGLLTIKTLKTEQCADEIIEALDLYRAMHSPDYAGPIDPKMAACGFTNVDRYFLFVLEKVRSGDLEFVLAQLPMEYVEEIFLWATEAQRLRWNVALLTRCFYFLERLHFKALTTNERLRPLYGKIADYSIEAHSHIKQMDGFAIAALEDFIGRMGTTVATRFEVPSKTKPKSKKKKTAAV